MTDPCDDDGGEKSAKEVMCRKVKRLKLRCNNGFERLRMESLSNWKGAAITRFFIEEARIK